MPIGVGARLMRLKTRTERVPVFRIGRIMLLCLATACDGGTDPAETGELSVLTETQGSDPDPDGYLLSVDGEGRGDIASSATRLISGLAEGAHEVLITGVAENCTVSGDNPRTVSVVGGQTVQTQFLVTCGPTTGSVDVMTATTGEDPDDEYTLSVDGEAPLAVNGNGTLNLSDLPEGPHTFELGDVSANCTIAGENPRTVAILAGETESTTFDVSCAPAVGDLSVEIQTSGQDLDPDGFILSVDGGSPQLVAVDDTVVVSDLTVGPHAIELSGVASNCSVDGANPRSVEVTFGVAVTESFGVTCEEIPVPTARIVFHSDRDGDFEIYSTNADGTDVIQLTDNAGDDLFPTVSPDGQLIAFTSDRGGSLSIYTMRADGSNVVQVTNGGTNRYPAWSPAGNRLAFASWLGGIPDIYTVRVDGTGLTRLTDTPYRDVQPAWSPDGLKIAFETDRDGNEEIYTMNASDGSDPTNLTNHPGLDVDADWSPDGSLILFHRKDKFIDEEWLGDGEIMCMAADGSDVIRMTTDTSGIVDWKPRWSPDGLWFVFSSDRDEGPPGTELYTAPANECKTPPASVSRVTESPGRDAFADFFPN